MEDLSLVGKMRAKILTEYLRKILGSKIVQVKVIMPSKDGITFLLFGNLLYFWTSLSVLPYNTTWMFWGVKKNIVTLLYLRQSLLYAHYLPVLSPSIFPVLTGNIEGVKTVK